jgi:hypothetical protein
MKSLRVSAILCTALPLFLPASDIDGKWKASFVGSIENRPCAPDEMVFDLKADGNKLTGMAHMGNWPGDAPISEGKIDGDNISFTAIGKSPWRANGQGWRSSGYPRLKFSGTILHNEINLTLRWDNILIYGTQGADGTELQMQGQRLLDPK